LQKLIFLKDLHLAIIHATYPQIKSLLELPLEKVFIEVSFPKMSVEECDALIKEFPTLIVEKNSYLERFFYVSFKTP